MDIENKYINGKIYKIVNTEMPNLDYYGSTYKTLKKRMTTHASPSNTSSSKVLFEYGTPEIVLIEDYPCNSRKELERREGEYHIANECINKVIAGRTNEEYRIDNKDKLNEKNKNYRANNKDKIIEKGKIYRSNNKEKLNEKFECDCSGKYTWNHKARHIKTKKHQSFISSKIV